MPSGAPRVKTSPRRSQKWARCSSQRARSCSEAPHFSAARRSMLLSRKVKPRRSARRRPTMAPPAPIWRAIVTATTGEGLAMVSLTFLDGSSWGSATPRGTAFANDGIPQCGKWVEEFRWGTVSDFGGGVVRRECGRLDRWAPLPKRAEMSAGLPPKGQYRSTKGWPMLSETPVFQGIGGV